jgi:hypothetical protein
LPGAELYVGAHPPFYFRDGAVKAKVCEPLCARDELVLAAEFEAWPEPKALTPPALRALMERFGGSCRAAAVIGASEAFVRQNGKETRVRGKPRKRSARLKQNVD